MNFHALILFISAIAISLTTGDDGFDDFCTLSGSVNGLKDFSSISVKL
jgi:hypothetical protein